MDFLRFRIFRGMEPLLILPFLVLPFDAAGYAKECWHCFSVKYGNCENPYKGRYGPNSTILKPDCSHDMARAFHATVIYVLSTTSRIVEIGANDTQKWSEINLTPSNFDCCKSEMNVVTFDGVPKSLIVRGCCTVPSTYDQCREVEKLCLEMTQTTKGPNGTVNRSTCKVTHCSTCTTDSCNSANVKDENAFLANFFSITIVIFPKIFGWI